MDNKKIQSHIQMPKLLLKRFSYSDEGFHYYLDVLQGYIGRGHFRSTNTEKGYYSETMEEILNESIETPFSRILQMLDGIDFDSGTFNLDLKFEEATKLFLYALLARNPKMIDKGMDESIFLQFLCEQDQHDLMVLSGVDEAGKMRLFDKYIITFTINKSNVPFVLPISGLYYYSIDGVEHINLPIGPNLAITLVDKDHADKILQDGVVKIYIINEDRHVNKINSFAYRSQCKMGYGRIISNNKEALLMMKNEDV